MCPFHLLHQVTSCAVWVLTITGQLCTSGTHMSLNPNSGCGAPGTHCKPTTHAQWRRPPLPPLDALPGICKRPQPRLFFNELGIGITKQSVSLYPSYEEILQVKNEAGSPMERKRMIHKPDPCEHHKKMPGSLTKEMGLGTVSSLHWAGQVDQD